MKKDTLNWKVLEFDQLDLKELYQILQLRSEVFVVEQTCVYQDIDGKDQNAWHVMGFKADVLVAYARIFKAGDYFDHPAIGRVLIRQTHRGEGWAHQLMENALTTIATRFGDGAIQLSAQTYLIKFYESHGFKTIGETYLEDGIPHIRMVKKALS